eukprot:GHVS01007373.1.p1 GENE.GHVS01007373.1~~GHVS01007373.1.p1  ORF type:complete len:332 (-),score=40.77 GHVS01007373.1:113-1108(-)
MRNKFWTLWLFLELVCVCSRHFSRARLSAVKVCSLGEGPKHRTTVAKGGEQPAGLNNEGKGTVGFLPSVYSTEFARRISCLPSRRSVRSLCTRQSGLVRAATTPEGNAGSSDVAGKAGGMEGSDRVRCEVEERRELAERVGIQEIARRTTERLVESSANFITVADYRRKEIHSLGKIGEEGTRQPNKRLLWGVPVGVKDNIAVKGMRTTAGSSVLSSYHPSYSATVVERVERSGGIVAGKTNMDEFAMGSCGSSAYLHTPHPLDPLYSPGGSSGGSAACVASGELCLALGSDTGGSVRLPASWCGCVGMKPTYGRVSYRYFANCLPRTYDR